MKTRVKTQPAHGQIRVFHLDWDRAGEMNREALRDLIGPGKVLSPFPSREEIVLAFAGCGLYEEIAVLNCSNAALDNDPLEPAYHSTQNIAGSWTQAMGFQEDRRSSSMGDVFVLDGEAFLAASVGFTPVPRFLRYVKIGNN